MIFITQCEIEIFGKPISLEVSLLETGAALKYPTFRNLVMRVDPGKYPAEDVILLDDTGQERRRRRRFENFAPVDHVFACSLAEGTQSRQAVISFFEGSAGSSRA